MDAEKVRVNVTLDQDTLQTLQTIDANRSLAIRRLVAAWRKLTRKEKARVMK